MAKVGVNTAEIVLHGDLAFFAFAFPPHPYTPVHASVYMPYVCESEWHKFAKLPKADVGQVTVLWAAHPCL